MDAWKPLVCVFVVVPAMLCAADVRVHIAADSAAASCLRDAVVVAADESSHSVRASITTDETSHVVSLPRANEWRITVENGGCWAETVSWTPEDGKDIVVSVFSAASVEGTFEHQKGAKPRQIRALIYPRKTGQLTDGHSPALSGSESSCTFVNLQWRCVIPADVQFDLRIDVPGFAAVHYWDLVARPSEVRHLEPHALRVGGSISGWISDPDDKPIKNARVTAFPGELISDRPSGHVGARLYKSTANTRGFFQIAGLEPGHYRIVSEASGFSPLVISDVRIRGAEAAVLPKPLRHVPLAALELTFTPATDSHRRRWTVELTEATALYPGRKSQTIAHSATEDGTWEARGLRADLYELVVRDAAGSIVNGGKIDLFNGGRVSLNIPIQAVMIHGSVRAGSDPLKADLQLWNESAGVVRVSTDEDGHFTTALPAAGSWKPTVLYPPGRSSARIQAAEFRVPENSSTDSSHEVIVQLPGGRIHGDVVSQDGRRGRAAVHAYQSQRLVAQQMTDDEGKFDLIGLGAGNYYLDAQSAAGSTPEKVEVRLDIDESLEITLVTQPTILFSGYVIAPDGRPASGAAVRISDDGGSSWITQITDVNGFFQRQLDRRTAVVELIVLTFDYPSTLLVTPVREEPLRIQLHSDGGIIRFGAPRMVFVSARGITAPINLFYFPEPLGRFGGGIYVESGPYTVCPQRTDAKGCRRVIVNAGTDQQVDFSVEPDSKGGKT